MEFQLTCPYCRKNISTTDYFCPGCGKKLKDKPLSTTFARQLVIYLISLFLPPLGLWPAISYLRQRDETAKKIGIAALFLTIISIVITSWLTINLINSFSRGLGSQFNFYNGIDLLNE